MTMMMRNSDRRDNVDNVDNVDDDHGDVGGYDKYHRKDHSGGRKGEGVAAAAAAAAVAAAVGRRNASHDERKAEGGEEEEEYRRPRRCSPETVSYVVSLPLKYDVAVSEIREYVQHVKAGSGKGNVDAATKDANVNKDDDDDEDEDGSLTYPPSLAASLTAIDEVRNELASLSCDERGSQSIECMARIGATHSSVAARKLLSSLSGYMVHVSTHRYGSHVLQTILDCAIGGGGGSGGSGGSGGASCSAETEAILAAGWQEEDADANANDSNGSSLPLLTELLVSTAEELAPFASRLAVHVCGSHVLRTLLCCLVGVELIVSPSASLALASDARFVMRGRAKNGTKKSKKRKKQHQMGAEERGTTMSTSGAGAGTGTGTTPEMRPVARPRIDARDSSVVSALSLLSDALSLVGDGRNRDREHGHGHGHYDRRRPGGGDNGPPSPPGELQRLACHPSGGPLLVVLLRVLARASDLMSSSMNNENTNGIHNDDNTNREEQSLANRRLGIDATEPTYSIGSEADVFVKRILCWDDSFAEPDVGGGNGSSSNNNNSNSNSNNDDGQTRHEIHQPYAPDVMYTLSGDATGSRLVETILSTCPPSFHDSLLRDAGMYDPSTFRDYVAHDVSNYVVQAALRTARTPVQARTLVMECVSPVVRDGFVLGRDLGTGGDGGNDGDVGGGGGGNSGGNKRRGGVLWKAAEMCSKHGVGQAELVRCVKEGFGTMLGSAACGSGNDGKDNVTNNKDQKSKRKKERSKKKKQNEQQQQQQDKQEQEQTRKSGNDASIRMAPMRTCICNLLNLKPPEFEGGRATMDVAGARTIYHFVKFGRVVARDYERSGDSRNNNINDDDDDDDTIDVVVVAETVKDVLDGLVDAFSPEEWVWIANDGMGSRCIMDAITDIPLNHARLIGPFISAVRSLRRKIEGRFAYLASQRVGHHAVRNLFRALLFTSTSSSSPGGSKKGKTNKGDGDGALAMAAELARSVDRLSGTAMGRSVMDACSIRRYMEGEEAWRAAVRKKQEAERFLEEMVEGDGDDAVTEAKSDGARGNAKGGRGGGGEGGGKRKRSNNKKGADVGKGGGIDVSKSENATIVTGKARQAESVVESIMNAMHAAGDKGRKSSSVDGSMEESEKKGRRRREKRRKEKE